MRIEVRRSATIGVAAVLLVAGVALVVTGTEAFSGRWTQLAMFGRMTLVLLLPLALAGGAWLGRRDRRYRVDELFSTAVRPRWQRLAPLACGFALILAVVYLLVLLLGAAWVAPSAGYFPPAALLVGVVGVPALAAAGWLGMAAGRAVPRVVTAPILAVLGFAVVALLPDYVSSRGYDANYEKVRPDPAALLLNPVATSIDDFQAIPANVSLLQLGWLVALAASGLLLLAATRRRAVALAVLPAVLGAAVTVPLLPTGDYTGAAEIDQTAIALICDDDGPQVCVTKAHAAVLSDVVGPARHALDLMAAKLPDPPTRAAESQRIAEWARPIDAADPARGAADTLVFDPPLGDYGQNSLANGYFQRELLRAGWRQECGGYDGRAYLAEELAAVWLTDTPPIEEDWWAPGEIELVTGAYQDLIALPAAEQGRRMAAAREAALDCQLDELLALMTGEDA